MLSRKSPDFGVERRNASELSNVLTTPPPLLGTFASAYASHGQPADTGSAPAAVRSASDGTRSGLVGSRGSTAQYAAATAGNDAGFGCRPHLHQVRLRARGTVRAVAV